MQQQMFEIDKHTTTTTTDTTTTTPDNIDTIIIQERNQAIQQINTDISLLSEIWKELSLIIEQQGESIDVIQQQVNTTSDNTQQSSSSLEKAQTHSKRKWLLKGTLLFSGITLGGIGLTLISPVTGIITAGAGITGIVGCISVALKKT